MSDKQPIRIYTWAKGILLLLLGVFFCTFVLSNGGAVVEPRVHLVFVQYERPALLTVLLLTTMVAFIAGVLAGPVLSGMHRFRDSHRKSNAARSERELAQSRTTGQAPIRRLESSHHAH